MLQTVFVLTDKPIVSINPKELKEHPLNTTLFGELSEEDYTNLKKDIQERGIQDPLHITKDNIVISGHQRRKIALELGVNVPCIIRKDLKEEWQIEEQLISDNLLRRHLSDYQKIQSGEHLEKIYQKKAELNKVIAANNTNEKLGRKHDTVFSNLEKPSKINTHKEVSSKLGMSTGNYSKARKVYQEAPEPIKQKWKKGKISTHKAYSELKKEQKKQQVKKELIEKYEEKTNEYKNNNDKIQLYNGDFYEICKQFKDESIDHIITDPPYAREFLPLWEKLSETAKRILKPGGFCIAYTGKLDLPQVIEGMGKHLDYYWQLAIILKDNWDRMHPVRMFAGYRPVLIYYKPPKHQQDKYVLDIIQGAGKEKDCHGWQQAEGEIKEILERFTRPNDVILDPFMGSGTTIIGCSKSNRRSIGIEIENETFKIAKGRIFNAKEN